MESERRDLINAPEILSEPWMRMLRNWGRLFEDGTWFTCLPPELRVKLYRLVFNCYPCKLSVHYDKDTIDLSMEDRGSRSMIQFSKKIIMQQTEDLLKFIDNLIKGWNPGYLSIDKVSMSLRVGYTPSVAFYIKVSDHVIAQLECTLCLELIRALVTVIMLAAK